MTHPASSRRRDHGFALLALLAVIGFGSVGVLLAVQAVGGATADLPLRTEHNLHTAAAAVRRSFLDDGAFAGTLDEAAIAGGLDPRGSWRLDPWRGIDLEYRNDASGRRLRSRGPDGRRNTADDATVVIAAEPIVRRRQRGRLRLLRAVLLRSPFCLAATMTPADHDSMRTALREHAIARRRWLGADAATRATLQVTLDASEAAVAALRATHALPLPPTQLTGAGGLLALLGVPDTRGVDGNGRMLLADPVLGVMARGYDRQGGTDDDM